MNWVWIILLALVSFALAAFVLRLPRLTWPVFGAALMFGLVGYALQGDPDMPAAPKSIVVAEDQSFEAQVEIRRILFGGVRLPSRHVITADGFARRGRFREAAIFLNHALDENPQNVEAWVALGNVLIEHAGGVMTPAAAYAYRQAEGFDADNPALAYFYGVSLIRMGRPAEAHQIWGDFLRKAPQDAQWFQQFVLQYKRLDELLTAQSKQQPRQQGGLPNVQQGGQ